MSELRANTISDAAGTGPVALTKQSAAKAWFQHGSTAIVSSFNGASFTDSGTGDYLLNLTNSFAGTDQSRNAIMQATDSRNAVVGAPNASYIDVFGFDSANSAVDYTGAAQAWGDLA